ncbi:MAG: ABC transporter substrate binding protein, partial [Suilimivivens sp.]
MKKFLALLLTVVMVCSLTACGGSSTEETSSESAQTAAETTETTENTEAEAPADAQEGDLPVYVIGICQLVQHEALDAATQGFKDALTEEMKDKAIIGFDEQNAQGDSNTCSTIINGFVSNNVDLILANATPAL